MTTQDTVSNRLEVPGSLDLEDAQTEREEYTRGWYNYIERRRSRYGTRRLLDQYGYSGNHDYVPGGRLGSFCAWTHA